ncbi:MAG: type IV secretion system protein, partial [Pseudomonadota bacterium]
MRDLLVRTALATTLGIGLHVGTLSPALAQGVPVVDTQNIAQNIQQLQQMIEDEILQNEQLTQLREQLGLLTDQLAELQRTYEAVQLVFHFRADDLGKFGKAGEGLV